MQDIGQSGLQAPAGDHSKSYHHTASELPLSDDVVGKVPGHTMVSSVHSVLTCSPLCSFQFYCRTPMHAVQQQPPGAHQRKLPCHWIQMQPQSSKQHRDRIRMARLPQLMAKAMDQMEERNCSRL